MRSTSRFARRLSLLVAVTASAAVVAPTVASATIPTPVNDAAWTLRTSWVNYLTNPVWYGGTSQGTVTATSSNGGFSYEDTLGSYTTWGGTYNESAYTWIFDKSTDTGTPRVVTLQGGLDFDMSAHGISVSLSDLKVRDAGSGAEELIADASYDPITGPPRAYLYDTVIANVSSAGAVTLTTAGASVFNGGSNGSYSNGSAFGSIAYH